MSARGLAAALVFAAALASGGVRAAAVAASAPAASSACPAPPGFLAQDEAAAAAADRGPLWKATKEGRTVWLYGTIHVAKAAWVRPGPRVTQALLASDTVALELDLTDPDVLRRLQKAILRRPGSPVLPDALEKRLLASMAAACIAPATLAPLRPEMQAVTLEVMQGRGMGLYPEFGIDTDLAAFAQAIHKPLRSLETPESQAALLVSDDPAETARSVGAVLDELEGGRSPGMLQRLAGDWERGDVDDIAAYASWCACMDTPEQRADFHKLIVERNPLMADKIVQWHAQGRLLFVAVGTLHMVGPAGLPTLLKARGFQVERVSFGDAR